MFHINNVDSGLKPAGSAKVKVFIDRSLEGTPECSQPFPGTGCLVGVEHLCQVSKLCGECHGTLFGRFPVTRAIKHPTGTQTAELKGLSLCLNLDTATNSGAYGLAESINVLNHAHEPGYVLGEDREHLSRWYLLEQLKRAPASCGRIIWNWLPVRLKHLGEVIWISQ